MHWKQQVLVAVVTAGFCAVNHGSWEEPGLLCPLLGWCPARKRGIREAEQVLEQKKCLIGKEGFSWHPVRCSSSLHFAGKQKADLWFQSIVASLQNPFLKCFRGKRSQEWNNYCCCRARIYFTAWFDHKWYPVRGCDSLALGWKEVFKQ